MTIIDSALTGKPATKRGRKGAGSVYRPKFRSRNGTVRFGERRIKFTYTDVKGIKHVHDEKVPGAGVNNSVAQAFLQKRMAEAKAHKPIASIEELTYDDLQTMLIANYEEKGHKSLLIARTEESTFPA